MTQSVVPVPRSDRNAQPQSHSCWLGSGKSALILILTIFGVLVCTGGAQVDPNAGILPFSTHVGGQYDTIDPATGNILLTIPIINKTGKMPFSFNLVGNYHAFIDTCGGYCQTWWVGDANGGGLNGVPPGGLWASLRFSYSSVDCDNSGTINQYAMSNFVAVDATGASHSL